MQITKKVLSALTVSMLAAMALVFGIQSPALATVYSGTIYVPSGDGYGTYNVNDSTETLSLSATSGALAVGECVTMYVDITRTGGTPEGTHYDIRAARTCRPWTTMSVGVQTEGGTYGTNITGVNKISVCRAGYNTIGTNCYHHVGALSGVNPAVGNLCSRYWVRFSDNSTGYYSGQKPWLCNG